MAFILRVWVRWILYSDMAKSTLSIWCLSQKDTRPKFNKHKVFLWHPRHRMNALCIFNLGGVSSGRSGFGYLLNILSEKYEDYNFCKKFGSEYSKKTYDYRTP